MPKLLVEFLNEQQEPFSLDVFLLERGHSIGTRVRTRRFLKRCYATRRCSKLVKAVFGRLALDNDQRVENCGNCEGDEHVFSSASGTTIYNSCSESDAEDAEVDAERELKWRSIEDNYDYNNDNNNKQLSPISVLEETDQTEESSSPLHQKQCNSKTTQEFEDSSNNFAQYIINKRAMQQSKTLLVDCVREVIENQRRKDDKNGEQLKKVLGSDELWKLVCENVWVWSQDSIDETNILQLLHTDFMASEKEWSSAFEKQRNEVCVEIGDAILEAVINEIITS
ncbi:hypothetical protein ACS0TY_025929 [Phlomoides rotata]